MNLDKLLETTKRLVKGSEQFDKELAGFTAEGYSGGKMVSVTVNGKHNMLSIYIDPVCKEKGDIGMITDLIISAHNDAICNINRITSEKYTALMDELDPAGKRS